MHTSAINIPAIRELIDTINKKYGPNAIITIYTDGSGRICYEEIPGKKLLLNEFDGLGELEEHLRK